MRKMWIGGEERAALGGETLAVENPSTEDTLDEVPRAREADVALAVQSSKDAFNVWRKKSGLERCELLHGVAREIRERREAMAKLLTQEGGKPFIENRDEVEWVAAVFDYYAEIGRDHRGRVIAPVQPNQFNVVLKEPYGVVGCIVPWNYPLLLLSWKLAPALAAGNTVVVKPSELTPLSTLMLAECLHELPPGAVNIVTGYGPEAGEALVRHKDVQLVAFTGSVSTGKRIAGLCAERIAKVNLELGGNDPFIVCDDVDLDVAVPAAAWAAFLNMGQVCTSAERFYVFDAVFDRFVERLVDFTHKLRIGDPLGPDVDLGPMASRVQRDKVLAKLEAAQKAGARLACGGEVPSGRSKGHYLEPAVVTGVNHGMALMREETFGPVAPVMRVRSLEEACALANESDYGLGASIMTNSLDRAMTAAVEIKAGTFWINDPLTDNDAGPFGGMRQSGMGRELGAEGLEAFLDTKHVHMDYRGGKKPYWFPYDWSQGRKTE
jgi:betaine-aldehyde dehydrogenase